jgi:hypothetical protein
MDHESLFLEFAIGIGLVGGYGAVWWNLRQKLDKETFEKAHEPIVQATRDLRDLVNKLADAQSILLTESIHKIICDAAQTRNMLAIRGMKDEILSEIKKLNNR